ncbi:BadF/BadG/BcrA/BcrD ATPase family protein [Kribbella sp. NPDC056861]|uniref:N-acetylglucosamine kinase n=1 Tax=Kribbella sp. NPDC056861 TaxID=3154857 RepID=UPI00343D2554
MTGAPPAAVLAIDAGNSKTDIVIVATDGRVLGRAQGGGFHPHIVGPVDAVGGLVPLVEAAAAEAGLRTDQGPLVEVVSACLANADLLIEEQRLAAAIDDLGWGRFVAVANDTFALLRAGVDEPLGVAVVCGAGINCVGLTPDGRTARFPAIGKISGDWGGGLQLADEAFWAAARADDGRGRSTILAKTLPQHYGMPTMTALIEALHLQEIAIERRLEATPVLFHAATKGDPVAAELIRRQASEIVSMAVVALRRLELLDQLVPVVLGGGVLAAGQTVLLEDVTSMLAALAPRARPVVFTGAPVIGAALLGLDRLGTRPEARRTSRFSHNLL